MRTYKRLVNITPSPDLNPPAPRYIMEPMKTTIARYTAILALVITNAAAEGLPPKIGMLYWVGANKLTRANADGTQIEHVVTDLEAPDGLSLDLLSNTVYWTNMADGPHGSVQRAHLDGTPIEGDGKYLVQPGQIHTGKEMELDLLHKKMYWSDRDAARIMRANLDGSDLETLVTAFTDEQGTKRTLKNPVGMALDIERQKMYFTDRYTGMIYRADMNPPDNTTHATRTDVEILVAGVPMEERPIDIDLDLDKGKMYWTDRHTRKVLRANLDGTNIETLIDESKTAIRIPIGLTLDLASKKMYWSDPATRTIQRANLDGSRVEEIVPPGDYRPLGLEYAAIQPEFGPKKGGQQVAIIGSNFIPEKTTVHFGKTKAAQIKVITPHLLHVTTPRGKRGKVDLTVATPSGKTTRLNAFRFN